MPIDVKRSAGGRITGGADVTKTQDTTEAPKGSEPNVVKDDAGGWKPKKVANRAQGTKVDLTGGSTRPSDAKADPSQPAGVFEPPPINKAPYVPAPKDATLFGKTGAPEVDDVRQGPIGDCYSLAPRADLAQDDPKLLQEHIREVGVAPNGDKLYGTIWFVPKDHTATVDKFQRAANDVTDKATGKVYTPVWVVVSDRVPETKDGSPDAADFHIPGHGDVMWDFLSEKAQASFHGETGYRNLNNGGDSATVFESMTGRAANTFNLDRDKDPKKDLALADQQFATLLAAKDAGKSVAMGSYGNAKPNEKQAPIDNDSIARMIRDYPQFDEHGKLAPDGKGYWEPKFNFADGAGNSDHNVKTIVNSRDGAGWVGDHEYSVLRAWVDKDTGVKMVELRNPWGDVRPEDFKDSAKKPDGKIIVPWYEARVLYGNASVGGRADTASDRAPLTGVTRPTLPAGTKPTFQLVAGETGAK